MFHNAWSLLNICVLTCLFGTSFSASNTTRYILSVIDHLTGTQTGVQTCVFFGLRPDSVLEDVLRAPQLEFTPKMLYTVERMRPVDVDRLPANILLFLADGSDILANVKQLTLVLSSLNPNTKLLVLVDTFLNKFIVLEHVVQLCSFSNVVYLDEKRRRMFLADTVKRSRIAYLAPPAGLFNGTLMRRMQGRAITYSDKDSVAGDNEISNINWLKETASVMNTTIRKVNHNCHSVISSLGNMCYVEHFLTKKIDVDLSHYYIGSLGGTRKFWLLCVGVTGGDVILVPRSQLSIVQLLTSPLNWDVWILLILVLGTLEMVKLLSPLLLRNDPILLAVCGFQRYNLDNAGRWEKMILFPAIVLLFFTTCAYETKLLSMMITKPAAHHISTMHELVESGIKIKMNFLAFHYANDSLLKPILVNSTDSELLMDKIHAYITTREIAKFILPYYYDHMQRLNRYTILDQGFGIMAHVFLLKPRCPFADILGQTRARLSEGGIIEKWNSLAHMNRLLEKYINAGSSNSLFFYDLLPAWIALGCGLLLGTGVLASEISVHVLMSEYRNRQLNKLKKDTQKANKHLLKVVNLFKTTISDMLYK